MKHYLDYNATAPLRPQVAAMMAELQTLPLNASSVHETGRQAKNILETSRGVIAEIIGAFASEVVFTASGTEANNWVLKAFSNHKVIISAVEHSSVFKTAHNIAKPSIVSVNTDGVIDLAALETLLPEDGKFIVSVMLANNETGVIQPVEEISKIVHKKGGLIHCDAVQAFGKIPVDFTTLGCDFMTLSAHKLGGPVGAAALVIRNKLTLQPLLHGGGQETGRRAGTENIVAIAGFSKAVELIDLSYMQRIRGWLESLESELKNVSRETIVVSERAKRLPNTACVTMPNASAETQLISFDLAGTAISAGSACSSGRIEPSHVLKAMQINEKVASTAVRISGGWDTKEADITAFKEAWIKLFYLKNTKT